MLSADDVFSDIFTLNTVDVMTQEIKSLFLVQRSNKSVCSSLVITMQFQTKQVHVPKFTKFEHSISAVILRKRSRLNSNFCKGHSGDVSVLHQFIMPPTLYSSFSFNYGYVR